MTCDKLSDYLLCTFHEKITFNVVSAFFQIINMTNEM